MIFQKCSSSDSPQTKSDIYNPSGQNVGDIEHNNISKNQFNPTVESQTMAAKVPALLQSQNPYIFNFMLHPLQFNNYDLS